MVSQMKRQIKNQINDSIFSLELTSIVDKIKIPERIHLKSAGEFDDKFIFSAGPRWTFQYAGSRRHISFIPDGIAEKLTKYLCLIYASTRMPTYCVFRRS